MQVQEALRVMAFTVGKPTPADSELLSVLNDCGEWFYTIHPWAFTARETFLSIPPNITFTETSWTANSLTLTHATAFASYAFLPGDKIEVTGGTGATVGYYEIASVSPSTSPTSIVLRTSLALLNLGPVITGTLHNSLRIPLPADFGEIEPGYPTTTATLNQSFCMEDLATVDEWRSVNTGGGTGAYVGAIVHGRGGSGGSPTPRLEIAPESPTGYVDAFVLAYRGRWVRQTTPTGEFTIPFYCEGLFKECLRHFTRGTFEEDVKTIDERLSGLMAGSLYAAAIRADTAVQPEYGHIEGGAVSTAGSAAPFQDFEILDPS